MRALLLSDIHGNLEALVAVLDAAAARFDTVWNLGDTVGYSGSPNQVIDLVRPLSSVTVRGNHDRVCCGLSSAVNFNPADFRYANGAELFLFLYFAMTGLHAVHMTIGLCALTYLYLRARREDFSEDYHTPVRVIGLYWHFVDVVWVFLYPMLYLISK